MVFPVQKNRRSPSSLPLFLVFLLAIILWEKSVSSVSALEHYPNGKKPSRARLRRIEKYLAKINKPAVLSIDSPDGDIIDCVDKYKQPAFDHPLLKNHTLPSFSRKENEKRGEDIEFSKRVPMQVWHLNGTWCPKDTVPIRRTTVEDVLKAKSLRDFIRKPPNSGPPRGNTTILVDNFEDHEHAAVRGIVTEGMFGMGATLSIWNPSVRSNEFSLAQLWLTHATQDPGELHTIEVGWQVYPSRDRNRETKMFVYWTRDNYGETGCYNTECTGFVQTGDFIVPGATFLTPYSTVNGVQYDLGFEISEEFGNWLIKVKGSDGTTHQVGRIPGHLLPLLTQNGANGADWGGEVVNLNRRRRGEPHTRTQMGSGRFAEEGPGRAAYFRNLFLVPVSGDAIVPQTTTFATNPGCYTVTNAIWDSSPMGLHFYYGGPGAAAPNCH